MRKFSKFENINNSIINNSNNNNQGTRISNPHWGPYWDKNQIKLRYKTKVRMIKYYNSRKQKKRRGAPETKRRAKEIDRIFLKQVAKGRQLKMHPKNERKQQTNRYNK